MEDTTGVFEICLELSDEQVCSLRSLASALRKFYGVSVVVRVWFRDGFVEWLLHSKAQPQT